MTSSLSTLFLTQFPEAVFQQASDCLKAASITDDVMHIPDETFVAETLRHGHRGEVRNPRGVCPQLGDETGDRVEVTHLG
jgi:hypothetical protein